MATMESSIRLTLDALPERFVITRLAPAAGVPPLPLGGALLSLTITPDEISVVCVEEAAPEGGDTSPGWRALRVAGELDFALIGILARLSDTLARAQVSVFALSTYTTDYLLVREGQIEQAVAALRAAGHTVNCAPSA
jgi:hypothetical protein